MPLVMLVRKRLDTLCPKHIKADLINTLIYRARNRFCLHVETNFIPGVTTRVLRAGFSADLLVLTPTNAELRRAAHQRRLHLKIYFSLHFSSPCPIALCQLHVALAWRRFLRTTSSCQPWHGFRRKKRFPKKRYSATTGFPN